MNERTYLAKTPDEERRIAAGQKGQLFRVEILYYGTPETSEEILRHGTYGNNQVCRHEKRDLFGHEVMSLREGIFSAGLAIQQDANHYIVVIPRDIVRVEVWRQPKFYGEAL